ncbi:hypothetical protein DICSQDRAFT_141050 [Dichomitus squalens LYAD-421 SS1]|uniref:Uncharacterized protein n=1 Tax=Dichomitus squalens (strain LYAD-421) TaxID=732165 RepID=R7SP21_DICSQ|nr:uncharacterized protein DICSQDRAFT_141050 [Dichomitus squalens LYAD-421 SS1]EJF56707.1 hypothetical protein DICSQDRAFT_141050 [Dichomitus squalens LYAD-421 SS1]
MTGPLCQEKASDGSDAKRPSGEAAHAGFVNERSVELGTTGHSPVRPDHVDVPPSQRVSDADATVSVSVSKYQTRTAGNAVKRCQV